MRSSTPTHQLWAVGLVVLVIAVVTACGGGGGESSDETTSDTSGAATSETTAAPDQGSEGSGSTAGGTTPAGAGPAGANTLQYSISGGYESSGERTLVPSMTFYDGDVWTLTFADEEGGSLVLINLDPSTPSVNLTEGTAAVAGDSSTCNFEVTRQDESGAAGSFTCSNVSLVDAGVLGEAEEFSGSFDASP